MGFLHRLLCCCKKKGSTPSVETKSEEKTEEVEEEEEGETIAEAIMNPDSYKSGEVAEKARPDLFANVSTAAKGDAPVNLPTNETPSIGFENTEVVATTQGDNQNSATELENLAHTQKALLSSDAVRYLVSTTEKEDRKDVLEAVITEAKKNYPLEDGWMVINESRMQNLCAECKNAIAKTEFTPTVVPAGASSLAEAIVTGNLAAAYELIGSRPMFALADAAADLDALYRTRKGGEAQVSDMLIKETTDLSDEKIVNMISALTGALDGTYSDEASAVKMAIMKAVKEVE